MSSSCAPFASWCRGRKNPSNGWVCQPSCPVAISPESPCPSMLAGFLHSRASRLFSGTSCFSIVPDVGETTSRIISCTGLFYRLHWHYLLAQPPHYLGHEAA